MTASDTEHAFSVDVDGQAIAAHDGQTIAAALMAAGRRVFRHTSNGQPRGLYCGMGVCFECSVTVDGVAGQRACVTRVRPGMRIHLPTGQEQAHGDD